jgi:subtilisin family serine protease
MSCPIARSSVGSLVRACVLCLLLCVCRPEPVLAASGKVGASVQAAVSGGSPARVVIALHEVPAAGVRSLGTAAAQVSAVQDRALAALAGHYFELLHRFDHVPGLVVQVDQAGLDALTAHPEVRRMDLDVSGAGSLASSVPVINADVLHGFGFTGSGVTVAVLDSGLQTDHPDLADDLMHQDCFLDEDGSINGVGDCPNGSDRQTGAGAAEDGKGHGTQTTGIVTSRGTVSAVGVAPDAGIVAVKVLDDSGTAGTFSFFTEIVAALDHIIASHPEVQVINMSLGTSALYVGDCDDSTAFNILGAAAVDTLRASGVVAFASSGNGSSGTRMSSPACLSQVISVGATDDGDIVAAFTNTSTTTDVMAPGVSVTSTGLGGGTSTGSGTSFASPHAAGCAALLLEAGLATTPDEIEARLESSGTQVVDATNGLSFPRIDCLQSAPAPAPAPALSPWAVGLLILGLALVPFGLVRWGSRPEVGSVGSRPLEGSDSGREVGGNAPR